FDDRVARLDLARFLRLGHHRDGDAVLDRRERVEGLELDHYFRRAFIGHSVEPHQGRVADQLRDVVVDLSVGHGLLPFLSSENKKPRGWKAPGPSRMPNCERALRRRRRSVERTLQRTATGAKAHEGDNRTADSGTCQTRRRAISPPSTNKR